MIAYLKGEVIEIEEEKLILECQGVGYNIFMPASALDGSVRPGQEVKVHTCLNVREDAMQLYGFWSRDDLRMFRMLLNVSGIGPKAALGILSALTADEVRFAVLSEDVKTISRAPGIGKKTAQKMILELKDKLDLQEAFETKSLHVQEASQAESGDLIDAKKEAVQALSALGYSGSEALRAVKQAEITPDMEVEEILKLALKKMSF